MSLRILHCLIATTALLGPAVAASAQDARWGGLYAGVFADYSAFAGSASQNGIGVGSATSTGPGAGAILGIGIPLGGSLVAGVEGDFSWDDRRITRAGDDYVMSHWGTLRLKLGYLASPDLLLYASAGAAFADFDYVDRSPAGNLEGSEHIWGFAAGAGAELAVHGSLRLRAEYLYTTFETWDFAAPVRHRLDSSVHIGRLGATVKVW